MPYLNQFVSKKIQALLLVGDRPSNWNSFFYSTLAHSGVAQPFVAGCRAVLFPEFPYPLKMVVDTGFEPVTSCV